jgi:hypothetical protein
MAEWNATTTSRTHQCFRENFKRLGAPFFARVRFVQHILEFALVKVEGSLVLCGTTHGQCHTHNAATPTMEMSKTEKGRVNFDRNNCKCTLDDGENNLAESVFARNELGNLHHVSSEALLGHARHELNLPPEKQEILTTQQGLRNENDAGSA